MKKHSDLTHCELDENKDSDFKERVKNVGGKSYCINLQSQKIERRGNKAYGGRVEGSGGRGDSHYVLYLHQFYSPTHLPVVSS